MSKRVVLWLSVTAGVAGVIFLLIWLIASVPSGTNLGKEQILKDNDWVKGASPASITLIEYSDFQCPACAAYYPLVKSLVEEFGDKLQLVYRHFPLKNIHQNAELAALAAEAAGRQGKFWEMHDFLFERQNSWSQSNQAQELFISYAKELNLNIEQFKNDLTLKELKEKVNQAYLTAIALGLNSTPTFFLNGQRLQNPRSYEQFREVIEKALQNQ